MEIAPLTIKPLLGIMMKENEKILKFFRSKTYVFFAPLVFGIVSGFSAYYYYSISSKLDVITPLVGAIIVGSIVTSITYYLHWIHEKKSPRE